MLPRYPVPEVGGVNKIMLFMCKYLQIMCCLYANILHCSPNAVVLRCRELSPEGKERTFAGYAVVATKFFERELRL